MKSELGTITFGNKYILRSKDKDEMYRVVRDEVENKLPADAFVYRYNKDVHVVAGDDYVTFLDKSGLKGLSRQQKISLLMWPKAPLNVKFINNFMSDAKIFNLKDISDDAFQSPNKVKDEIFKQLDIKVITGPDIEITER